MAKSEDLQPWGITGFFVFGAALSCKRLDRLSSRIALGTQFSKKQLSRWILEHVDFGLAIAGFWTNLPMAGFIFFIDQAAQAAAVAS